MRPIWVLALVLGSAHAVSAQERQDPLVAPMSVHLFGAVVSPEAGHPGNALLQAEPLLEAERDRIGGAFVGALIGAAVGGVGFAVADTSRRSGREYLVVAFLVGATIGGVSGAVVGAVLGMPKSQGLP